MNFYELLNVEPTASCDEIKKTTRPVLANLHPDRAGDAMQPLFVTFSDAYNTLTDPQLRADYDAQNTQVPVQDTATAPRPLTDFEVSVASDSLKNILAHAQQEETLALEATAYYEKQNALVLHLAPWVMAHGAPVTVDGWSTCIPAGTKVGDRIDMYNARGDYKQVIAGLSPHPEGYCVNGKYITTLNSDNLMESIGEDLTFGLSGIKPVHITVPADARALSIVETNNIVFLLHDNAIESE